MTDTPKTAPTETPAVLDAPVAAPPAANTTPDAKSDDKPGADLK
jgi:hypothetical protein